MLGIALNEADAAADEPDGAGREGFVEWASGVGYNKDPALFGTLRFHAFVGVGLSNLAY